MHQHLEIFNIVHGDKVLSSSSVVGSISLSHMANLESTRLDHTTGNRTSEAVSTASDAEVGDGDLVRVAVDDGGCAEIVCVNSLVGHLQLEVAAVVQIVPLQLFVGGDQP